MSTTKQKSAFKKINLYFRVISRRYPVWLYISKWLFISTIVGITAGTASAFFLQSLDWVTTYRENHLWLITLLPIAGLLTGLIYHYWGKELEGGNNLLLSNIHQPGKIIPFRMAPFAFIGTMATHLFGGSAGREGTALQMAGAIADQYSKPLRLNAGERKMLLIAAIAAGFGSVFGTPLAGAVFGLEVFLIGRLKYDAIFPAFAAAVIADLVTGLWHTHHITYAINVIPAVSAMNIIYALITGLACGAVAILFSKGLHYSSSVFKSTIASPPLRPFAGGIIIALAIWAVGTTKYIGLGIPTIVAAFDQHLPAYDFILKIIFTIITLAAGFKGGEVTPLFFIGAALGNALSGFIPLPAGLLAGMGFVAVFAAATNTPLACTIMAMELFGSRCGVYVAIACVTAYLVSGHNSIYDQQVIGSPKHQRFSHYQGKQLEEL